MFNEKGQVRWKTIGWVPVAIIFISILSLVVFDLNGPGSNQPNLVFVLQFIFVFCVSVLLTIVSARAYLSSGSLSILFIGIASLFYGVLLMVAQWAVTPSLGSTLTPNEATTIGNIGILLASVLLFLSAILLWSTEGRTWLDTSRKFVLGASYIIAAILIVVVTMMDISDQFPVFFISGTGSTLVRQVVLALSGIFLIAACSLFGWKYLRTRYSILYWYSLGLVLFAISLIGIVYTVRIGDTVNWSGRIGLYLTGIYFLIAVLSNDTGLENRAGPSERWAEAFGSDRRQVASLLSNMTSAFAYGRIVTDDDGRPIDTHFPRCERGVREDPWGR